jgi:hypothetical protein
VDSSLDKVAAIEEAQKAGLIPDRFSATNLLTLVLTLAATWTAQTPEYHSVARKNSAAESRALVTDAVAILVSTPAERPN